MQPNLLDGGLLGWVLDLHEVHVPRMSGKAIHWVSGGGVNITYADVTYRLVACPDLGSSWRGEEPTSGHETTYRPSVPKYCRGRGHMHVLL